MLKITPELPEKLQSYLAPGAAGVLVTAGDDGYASTSYTWVVALDDKRVRFIVDNGGTTQTNLERTGKAALHIIGPENLLYLVKGEAKKVKDRVAAAEPASIQLFEMEVMGARDQSWPGVSISAMHFEWSADKRESLQRMELAVIEEMRA